MEEWRDWIRDNRYQISTLGRVRSSRGILKLYLTGRKGNQYYNFGVWDSFNKRIKNYLVHIAVLETFIGERPEGMQGCHNNGNNRDCSLGNLRWDTPQNNSLDRWAHGTMNCVYITIPERLNVDENSRLIPKKR